MPSTMGLKLPDWTSGLPHTHRGRTAIVATIALGGVLATTALFETLVPVNATTAGFAYLIEVLLTAAYGGFYESVAASVVAAACFNYFFLPPLRTWVITDPHNWVALCAFLLSSLIASQLSANARRREVESTNRRLEMERLYELSRSVMLMRRSQSIAEQVVEEILRIYPVRGVGIFESARHAVHAAGDHGIPDLELRLKMAARDCRAEDDQENEILIRPLTWAEKCIGSVALRGISPPGAAIHALVNLIAIGLENARSHQIANRAEAVRQSEEFKSTLLDALAHEFKTPLTSIKGATSALLSGGKLSEGQRADLLTVVDEEAERLNQLVTEATHVARVAAGNLQLNREPHSVAELIAGVLDQMALGRNGRTVSLSIEERLPPILVDPQLMQLALRQLLDNALKYSAPRSPLGIRAGASGGAVEIGIHNWGEALSPEEQARVFSKFYRGHNVRQYVPGTGMGLAIAREILAAHGGRIRVVSSVERGTEFFLCVPTTPGKEEA